MPKMIVLLSALAFAAPPGATFSADEWRARTDAETVAESTRAGNPANPAPKKAPSAEQSARDAVANLAKLPPTAGTFILPAAVSILQGEACSLVGQSPAGIERADGKLNGSRTFARCGKVFIDVLEMDFRQPLKNKVEVRVPEAAINAEFGPGKSIARYYVLENGEHSTALTWYDGKQEVVFKATGTFEPSIVDASDKLRRMMRAIVARRINAE